MRNSRFKSTPDDGILVSIILSESTTSLLNLNIQTIENVSETRGSMCVIKSVNKSDMKQKGGKLLSSGENEFDISSEFAYFSESYRSDSDSSVSSLDDIDGVDDTEIVMEPTNLYMRPLIAAKTIAHDNRMEIDDNKICVSLFIEDLCLVDSEYICRICHGGESIGDLLAPCKCKGTIALAHMECLEHWLRESTNSYCELCQHHYNIIREPRYSVPWSVLMYILKPGDYWKEVITDIIAFIIYTPSAFVSTYMLMLICENIAKTPIQRTRNFSAHMVAFCAVFGMAAIDFTYSSWLIITFQRQVSTWRSWYRNNSFLKIVLPEWRKRPYRWSQSQGTSDSK